MDVESTDRATDPGDPGNVRPGCHARTVSETYDFEARIEELAALVAPLGWKLPRVRDPAAARRCARGLHLAFVHVARGRRAIDVAIGEGLDALSIGSRAMDLGYSSPEDYAREELGINASTAAKMRRLARAVRDLPLIKGALRRGEISPRKAEIVAPVATRENEAMWLFRIKAQTVRSLRADVKAPREPDEEEMVHFCAEVPKESQPLFDTALELAGTVLGNPTATKMERVRAWCEEYQSGHPAPPDDRADVVLFTAEDARERIEEDLEKQHAQWPELEVELCVPAPQETAEIDPFRIDAELRGHLKKRERWDEVLGQIALIFQSARAWDLLGFGSFRQYCEEQLGMAERTVEQRASLERALQKTPLLRQALRDKRLSYEKARLIARHATPDQVPASIERAEKLTRIALRRELQDHEERQMCARGDLQRLDDRQRRGGGESGLSHGQSRREALPPRRRLPPPHRGALRRHLAAPSRQAEHAPPPRPRPRQAPLPGPRLQSAGLAQPPHPPALPGRSRRGMEPGQPLRLPPPARHPRRTDTQPRQGAGRADLGGRPAQLRRYRRMMPARRCGPAAAIAAWTAAPPGPAAATASVTFRFPAASSTRPP